MTRKSSNSGTSGSVLSWRQGLETVLAATEVLSPFTLPVQDAGGHVLVRGISAGMNVPPFTNSAMDGFAVIAGDTADADSGNPVVLTVIGEARAGTPFSGFVASGSAVEVMTGAPIPDGADAVVRVEDTRRPSNDRVEILSPVALHASIRQAGADTMRGDLIAGAGTIPTPGLLGLLASCGFGAVEVYPKPRVALLAGGDELVDPGSGDALPFGKIFDSNSPMLLALLRSWGINAVFLGRVPDDTDALRAAIRKGAEYDILVVTGGVSMGKHDHVRNAFDSLGGRELFWRLNQQPGGPLLVVRLGDCLAFGLPGNPVSCYVCSDIYLRAAIRRASGWQDPLPRIVRLVLAEELLKSHSKVAFVRGRVQVSNGEIRVCATGPQDSNIIHSVASHDGYIVFPEERAILRAGNPVDFILARESALADCCEAILDTQRSA